MNLGQVYQSINSWKRFAEVNMRPKVAFAILKYSKVVTAEFDLIESKRRALVYEVTEAESGTDVRLERGTLELEEFVQKFNELLVVESDIKQIDMNLSDAVGAIDEKDESLTVSDLALLEPFFKDYVGPVEEKADE